MLRILERARECWLSFLDACRRKGLAAPTDEAFKEACELVFASSRFVHSACIQDPGLLIDLQETGRLAAAESEHAVSQMVSLVVSRAKGPEQLSVLLRRLRRREMVRIAWRDITSSAHLEETMRDLTALAEGCLSSALQALHEWARDEYGAPTRGDDNRGPGLMVIGMGKLGGRELNFSSDVDLIFVHPGSGRTGGGQKGAVTHDEFFTLLARRLINAVGAVTPEGFVFRVDTRLRPFGEGGPLVVSRDALEDYYQQFGRDWERYALVKARPVAGDIQGGREVLRLLQPFVYRRYLDYEVFDSLRSMKALVETEITKKGLRDHVKLGPGGIREIEFICQVFQLLMGGRVPELQEPSTLKTLDLLAARGLLPQDACRELGRAYRFLRTVEHRLQEYDDRQVHLLPQTSEGLDRLAFSMGYASREAMLEEMRHHRDVVHGHFSKLLATKKAYPGREREDPFFRTWKAREDREQCIALLRSLGFQEPGGAAAGMRALSASKTAMATRGLERLEKLIPLVLREATGQPEPDKAFSRTIKVIESIGRRPVYLSLLVENPKVISHLISLCSRSAWVADLLARHPILLDELLAPPALRAPLDKETLRQELRAVLARIPPGDLELFMDEMRRFRQANVLRVAACDLSGITGVKEVGRALSAIAEATLDEVLTSSWKHLCGRHGLPGPYLGQDPDVPRGIVVVGYGKLGGMEMGYNSDLDLVFLHALSPGVSTTGARPIDAGLFYSRIGQRMIHMLTAHTPAGVLYPVDMRLRPNGSSGVLVTGIESFLQYQRSEAWTWEHQALVRARAVCGDPELASRFEWVRREILRLKRDTGTLKRAILKMRKRITEREDQKDPDLFDIKHHAGGLVDIEFLVQFIVLSRAHEQPGITSHTNLLDLIEAFRDLELMPPGDAAILEEGYTRYMSTINKLALDNRPAIVEPKDLYSLRQKILEVWERVVGGD